MPASNEVLARSPLERLTWLEAIQKDPAVGACATAVAAALAVFGNSRSGEAHPSLQTLARRTKRSLTATKKSIKQLAARGWIKWTGAGDRGSNHYSLTYPAALVPAGMAHGDPPRALDGRGGSGDENRVGHSETNRTAVSAHEPGVLNKDLTWGDGWRQVLEAKVGQEEFEARLARLSLDHVHDATAFLTAPTGFYRDQALSRHEQAIVRALAVTFPEVARVRIKTTAERLH